MNNCIHLIPFKWYHSTIANCREASIGISYDDDPEKAMTILREILASFSKIPTDPSPQIGIEQYADSSINIGMRYWVPTKAYFEILYAVNLAIYNKFKESGITIPYPQRDVHVVSDINQKF